MEKPFHISPKFIDELPTKFEEKSLNWYLFGATIEAFLKRLDWEFSNDWNKNSEMTEIRDFQKMSEMKFIDEVSDRISIIETSSCWT